MKDPDTEDRIAIQHVKLAGAVIWGALSPYFRPTQMIRESPARYTTRLNAWRNSRRINRKFAGSPLVNHYADCMHLDAVRINKAILKVNKVDECK